MMSRLMDSAPQAISQMDCSCAETSRVKQFEILSYPGSECRLSAADDHRMEKQVTFVDEIGFERKCCQFGAANEDVVRRSRGVRADSPPAAHPSAPSSHRVAAQGDGFRSAASTQG